MTFLRRVALVSGAFLVCVPFLAGCSSDDDTQPKDCPIIAAFDLTIRAVTGPLPADTELQVTYGGGTETYRIDTEMPQLEIVSCKKDTADGGDAGSEVTAIHCKLWTQAAATVTVTATGYPAVKDKKLEAKADGKCIQTVPVEIVLGDTDAGS